MGIQMKQQAQWAVCKHGASGVGPMRGMMNQDNFQFLYYGKPSTGAFRETVGLNQPADAEEAEQRSQEAEPKTKTPLLLKKLSILVKERQEARADSFLVAPNRPSQEVAQVRRDLQQLEELDPEPLTGPSRSGPKLPKEGPCCKTARAPGMVKPRAGRTRPGRGRKKQCTMCPVPRVRCRGVQAVQEGPEEGGIPPLSGSEFEEEHGLGDLFGEDQQ